MNTSMNRRNFLQLSASFGAFAGLASLGNSQSAQAATAAAQSGGYKALVCVFLFGGNDGHNTVVPLSSAQYNAYLAARPGISLAANQLLPINDAAQGAFGLHYLMPEMQTLYQQNKLAIVPNVGMLVRPTTYQNYQQNYQLPLQLRSHADQVVEMQTGIPNSGGSTGWGGRALDLMQNVNANAQFPLAVAMNSPALFCSGAVVQGTSLQPGNLLDQAAMGVYPPATAQARMQAQMQSTAPGSGNAIIDAANKVMTDANTLNPLLKSAGGGAVAGFPSSVLGNQLKEVARVISLQAQLNVARQVFFVSLGGFDTHAGQSYQQGVLLQQVSQALKAFNDAMVTMGMDNQVTAFTMSDFGRTLQPSGTGCDHGWGNHHFVVGGAVNGGKLFGQFPQMTNYLNFNSSAEDYADQRGTLLPHWSLSQYAATLAKWFGAADAQLDGLFPTLPSFAVRDVGFMF